MSDGNFSIFGPNCAKIHVKGTGIDEHALYGEMNGKGRFTRYDFVAYDKLTTGLRHELFRVNQTYNLLTTVVYVKKMS